MTEDGVSLTNNSDLKTSLIVDFMSLIHRLSVEKKSGFIDLFKCCIGNYRVDEVFDSYLGDSINEDQ